MRKAIVVCLVLLFVLSIAGPVFAAEGTFCDVPKNHWSYEAIDELVKAGVIDNSSKIFNGDRMVTRYEMALMVAKAMKLKLLRQRIII
ncbi:MAG: S-layer protein [Firmicutes bacterium]|nr:S-layer protein [Bacillota bacterium]